MPALGLDPLLEFRLQLTMILALLLSVLPVQVMGQAGSSSPLVFASAFDFTEDHDPANIPETTAFREPTRPQGVLRLPRDERYLIWIELEAARLLVLEQQENGSLIPVRIMPISIGKNGIGKEVEGDRRTPLGIYRFTGYFPDNDLIDFYGLGAYPLNYPNVLDRRQNRTGSGIWLHGLPKGVTQRPLMDSDGCVVIDNISLQEMKQFIEAGRTHVVLTRDSIQWRPVETLRSQGEALEDSFNNWVSAWEARDNDQYLSFYHEGFSDFGRNLAQWSDYKRRVNNGKSYIDVDVSSLSFFADPEDPQLVTVRYYQEYQSNNYDWSGWKEQLWRNTDEGWRIMYEGNG